MALGWGQVAGLGAKLLDRVLDPRRQKEALAHEKAKLLRLPFTVARGLAVERLDARIARLQRQIEREAG